MFVMDSVSPDTGLAGEDQTGRSDERAEESRPVVGEDAMIALQIQGLGQLFEIGLAIAGALGRVATGQASPAEARAFAGTDMALAFGRMAKAMGQITLLTQETVKLRESRRDSARTKFQRARKGAAERAVREIAAASPAKPGSDAMKVSLSGLFLRYDDYDDYCHGTFEEVVARICRDLGITPDPEMLRRVAEARAVAPEPPPPPLKAAPDWRAPPPPRVEPEPPYTVVTTPAGTRVRVPLDSPHLRPKSQAPP